MDKRGSRRTRAAKGLSPAAFRWQALIVDGARGGQTQRAYCRRMRISAGTFAWWKHRLAGASLGPAPAGRRRSTPPRFVRVTGFPTDAPASGPSPEAASAELDRTPSTVRPSAPTVVNADARHSRTRPPAPRSDIRPDQSATPVTTRYPLVHGGPVPQQVSLRRVILPYRCRIEAACLSCRNS